MSPKPILTLLSAGTGRATPERVVRFEPGCALMSAMDEDPAGTDQRAGCVISAQEADGLAARLLGELRTQLGELHIVHARRVAAGVVLDTADDRVIAAALLHDVLEKSGTTAAELRVMTGDPKVVDLVETLTRRAGESDRDYLSRCAANPMTLLVKRLDLADKLAADASSVPPAVADEIRRQANERLELLNRLAHRRRQRPTPGP